jgi:sulfide:quinone oxidoreductase
MQRVVMLGAGFGLELATTLLDAVGGDIDVVLIDKNNSFVFGYSKLDVVFGRTTMDAVRLPYHSFAKPWGAVSAGDGDGDRRPGAGGDHPRRCPRGRRAGRRARRRLRHGCDDRAGRGRRRVLLGRRGRASDPGAAHFSRGRAIIGVYGAPFKCPPAPSEAAPLLHDHLVTRGIRDACRLSIVISFGTPVPPSPDTSQALVAAFGERDIEFVPSRRVASLDGGRTSTSCPGRSRPARSVSRRSRWAPRSRSSAPAAAPAGSGAEAGLRS